MSHPGGIIGAIHMNQVNNADLAPGFMVIHGNRAEALRDLMQLWVARHPLSALESEWVLVQSSGVAQWLKQSLATSVRSGGLGIAAALRLELPARFIWQAYRAVLGTTGVPTQSPFDKPLLVWRLMRLLPDLLARDALVPLRRFLEDDEDCRKRYQLAERLADLFDQYQVYRSDWLAEWASGEDAIRTSRGGRQPVPQDMLWQPLLWRALREDVGAAEQDSSRAVVHQRFLKTASQWTSGRPKGLPRRLMVFGISSLPQQSLEVLGALSRWMPVLLFVHNPCEHAWLHTVSDRDLLRATRRRQQFRPGSSAQVSDEAMHLHGHPLLAAWGKQGRDFVALLDELDDREAYAARFQALGSRVDLFERSTGDTLLGQLQDDIRELRPPAESRSTWPTVKPAQDRSIRFHIAHSPQREVQVLHDELLAAFAADASLQPRQVIVMVPDIAAYAPHVQAVFGQPGRDDRRHIPFTLADRGPRQEDPLMRALGQLLELPQSRLALSEVLDLLDVPALRLRFGIEEGELPLLRRWLQAARVRWGLHAGQREALGLPGGLGQNTWDFGLQRMLLGYAVGAGQAWEDIEPMDEVGGLEAALLGPLNLLLRTLERYWRLLSEPATPAVWGERLRGLLQEFFLAKREADGLTVLRLETALRDWQEACEAAGLQEELPLAVVRDHWLGQVDGTGIQAPFLGGGVTFATLMPMRAIPFRFVALLGMNDADYPRSRPPADFDLMARDWRPGDRSRREDDRYLFLEALLSARERLHISWVGRSIRDNQELPPSVLVAQLRDHLASGWLLEGGPERPADAAKALLAALTLEHRLQPFDPAYFSASGDSRLFSYAQEWQAAAPSMEVPGGTRARGECLDAIDDSGQLTLAALREFAKSPASAFLQRRLGIRFAADEPEEEDHEPFAFDALAQWRLQDELIRAQEGAVDSGLPRETALQAHLDRLARRGELPAGAFEELARTDLSEPMEAMFNAYAAELRSWPEAARDAFVDYLPEGLPESLRVIDTLSPMRGSPQGESCRLVVHSSSLVKDGRYHYKNLVPFWIDHLAGHLSGGSLNTVIVSRAGTVRLAPLSPEVARQHWARWLEAWQLGHRQPLPLALESAFAWLAKRGTPSDVAQGPGHDAYQAARAAYEDHDPEFRKFGEREGNAHLARAFPDFEALWAEGQFAIWADELLKPLMDHVKPSGSKKVSGEGAQ